MKEHYSRCLPPQGSTPFANPDMSEVQLGREKSNSRTRRFRLTIEPE